MGPLLLIDKSVLQSLTMDEVRVMWKHYDTFICPTLVHEIIGNLLKGTERPSEKTVKRVCDLAHKAHGLNYRSISSYESLALNDLFYGNIKMRPQIPRMDGQIITNAEGGKAMFFEESVEGQLLNKWSRSMFSNDDLKMAREHIYIKEIDLTKMKEGLFKRFPEHPKDISLEEIERFITASDMKHPKPWDDIEFYAGNLGLNVFGFPRLQKCWIAQGKPPFPFFAPYAYYCFRLVQIYSLGIMADLIPTSKQEKTWIDFQYFYYLPFAQIFCSMDDFQLSFSKYFLRPDQIVINGNDLRKDLSNISQYISRLTKEERVEYDRMYGSYPPPINDSITNDIWGKIFGPRSRGFGNRAYDVSDKEHEQILSRIKSFEDQLTKEK